MSPVAKLCRCVLDHPRAIALLEHMPEKSMVGWALDVTLDAIAARERYTIWLAALGAPAPRWWETNEALCRRARAAARGHR